MGIRYTPEELMRLRGSPLVTKPPGLPPTEEWMGPPSDSTRNRDQSKTIHLDRAHSDRGKLPLLDQTNRRPGLERHISRGNTNLEDIILGPPKTSFASATSLRNSGRVLDSSERPSLSRDLEPRDRYSVRKGADVEEDRRDGRSNNLRAKREEGDQDNDGWSTVKPRKSFGTEGAERFNGRMGGDRHKDDRRFRDREDRDNKERPARGFDIFSRDKDGDQEQESSSRRNGTGRGRNEPSWFKDANDVPPMPSGQPRDRTSNGDKFVDRSRGWREKDREDKVGDRNDDRSDRRWGRERRVERDPEWMDEPADEKKQAHTQEDFQKWKERMKAGSGNTPAEEAPPKLESSESGAQSSFFGLEKPKVETPLFIDSGPDKFFSAWVPPKQEIGLENAKIEGAAKSKTLGKSSRFTSFFSPSEDLQRRQTDPPPPVPALPQQENNVIQANREKEDFQRLLQKLQSQSFGAPGTTTTITAAPQPRSQLQEKQITVPPQLQDSYQQYHPDRNDASPASNRNSQQALQDLLGQRQTSISQPSSARPDQLVHELVNQRQNALSQSSNRQEQFPPSNRNAEFLMGLMQNARAAPEPMRSEQLIMRMGPQQLAERQMQQQQQRQQQQQQQQMNDLEQEMQREQRERSASQHQRRPDLQPGFYDEALFQRGPQPQHEGPLNSHAQGRSQPPQPTQILQRPPPGLDQLPPGWGAPNAQLPPPMSQQQQQQRHIAPPPGLPGGQSRGMSVPQNMFPPGFPMGSFGPPSSGPDGMMSGAPRNMPPPPPGFMMPPPGFMGGNMAMGAGMGPMNGFQQGPEMAFGGPFDGRGNPQGGFRR